MRFGYARELCLRQQNGYPSQGCRRRAQHQPWHETSLNRCEAAHRQSDPQEAEQHDGQSEPSGCAKGEPDEGGYAYDDASQAEHERPNGDSCDDAL